MRWEMVPIKNKTFAAAFRATLPVLMGYLSIGMAFGFMMDAIGYNFLWSGLMSLTIYAGSGQYLGVDLLAEAAPLAQVALMTLLINFRHLVYGLSMLEKFKDMGKRKLYMIFSLTDETYALLAGLDVPPDVNRQDYYFYIAILDHSYWIAGSILGGLLASVLHINTEGIDFAMTALFVVIFIGQWEKSPSHAPALIGIAATLGFLLLIGAESMLLPALALIVVLLLVFRQRLEPIFADKGEEAQP